tara:strand:+ start:165 stop:638 length:474 start_codon:yes stop_codon:yes gene_type:complete
MNKRALTIFTALGLSAAAALPAKAADMLPLIDAHVHYSHDAWDGLPPKEAVAVLRPYRKRGELGTWFCDPTVIDLLKSRLKKGGYAGIGEFHVFGEDADGPVFRKVVGLARKYKVFLHAHSDADAVERWYFVEDHAAWNREWLASVSMPACRCTDTA